MKKLPRKTLQFARDLRQRQTDAENLLWRVVRNRSLDGFKFRRQKPLGPYIVDFYCAEAKLAVELDGGGHLDEPQILHDRQRDSFLGRKGVLVLRYSNRELFTETEAVLEDIWNALQERGPSCAPSPCPSPAKRERGLS